MKLRFFVLELQIMLFISTQNNPKREYKKSRQDSAHSDSGESDDERASRKKSGSDARVDTSDLTSVVEVKKEKDAEVKSPSKLLQPKWRSRLMSSAAQPVDRDKPGWDKEHQQNVALAATPDINVVLTGDSIIKGLSRYPKIWRKYFAPLKALNFGIGGDKTQHVLWRLQNGELECDPKIIVVLCGTNNIDKNSSSEIAQGILAIVDFIRNKKPNVNIIVCGILPRDLYPSSRRNKVDDVNEELFQYISYSEELQNENVYFLPPEKGWTARGGELDKNLYFKDHLHLVEEGDEKLAKSITRLVKELLKSDDTEGDSSVPNKKLIKVYIFICIATPLGYGPNPFHTTQAVHQVFPNSFLTSFTVSSEERHCEGLVACLRKQHSHLAMPQSQKSFAIVPLM